jgi:integral membrane protein (TIGR01906 family)
MRQYSAIQALIVILLVPCLVGSSLMVMLFPQVTEFWSSYLSDFANSAVSRSELMDAAIAGARFVAGGADEMPRGDSERTAFTEEVVSHMQDVRDVIAHARLATIGLGLLLSIAGFLLAWRGQVGRLGRSMSQAAVITIALAAILATAGCLSFDALFTQMHRLLFADGTWTFSYDSLLITAYPEAFWIAMAATWAAVLAAFCLVTLVVGRALSRRSTYQGQGPSNGSL